LKQPVSAQLSVPAKPCGHFENIFEHIFVKPAGSGSGSAQGFRAHKEFGIYLLFGKIWLVLFYIKSIKDSLDGL
jgi:hypothetical protein